LEAARAAASDAPRAARLPRGELVARVEAARKDPRFAQPVAVAFHKRSLEQSTDDELAAMLDAIELLKALAEKMP
jgi:hypothetical protein